MATLKSQMVSDVAAVFLRTDEHADTIWLWPRGNRNAGRQITAIVDQNALEGSRESMGDGRRLNDPDGYAIRESVVIRAAATAGFADEQDPRQPDIVEVNGEAFAAKRILARDAGLVSVLCVRMQRQWTRTRKLSG